VSNGRREESGIPRGHERVVVPPGGSRAGEDWRGANDEKGEKLRRNALQRRAGSRGLELRHTAYGYSLIDAGRQRVEDRSDMTLDEIESWLERG